MINNHGGNQNNHRASIIAKDMQYRNRVWVFAQSNKGHTNHSKMQIAEAGKTQIKELVCRVVF